MKSRFGELALLLLAVFAVGSITMQPSRRTAAASTAGRIVATGNTTAPRFSHTATLLLNGKVLIAGGMERKGVFLATAELYDPATGRFAPAGKMGATRGFGSTATPLPHGEGLITGGRGDSSDYYAAVLMKDGKVLVVGGSSAGQHRNTRVEASAEVYDPSTGRFTPTDRMRTPRVKFGAALLPDGRVLIVGGQMGGPWGERLATTEIYDPATGTFIPGPNMGFKRFKIPAAVVPLRNRRILLAGGADQPEVYDPASKFSSSDGWKQAGQFLFLHSDALVEWRSPDRG